MKYHLIGTNRHTNRESKSGINFLIDLLRNQDKVIELWYSNGEYSCLVTTGRNPGNQAYVGHGRTLESAVIDSMKGFES